METTNFKDFLCKVESYRDGLFGQKEYVVKSLSENLGIDYTELLEELKDHNVLKNQITEVQYFLRSDDEFDEENIENEPFEMVWHIKESAVFLWMMITERYTEKFKFFKEDIMLAVFDGYDYREEQFYSELV